MGSKHGPRTLNSFNERAEEEIISTQDYGGAQVQPEGDNQEEDT